MEQLDTWQSIALAAALGWASGIRLYAVLFIVGAVGYRRLVRPPAHLQGSRASAGACRVGVHGRSSNSSPTRFPAVDTLWDIVAHARAHSRRRGARGRRVRRFAAAWTLAAAILGGTLAAGSHFTKAGARAAINTSPEPFSNWAASFGEDVLVGTLLWLAFAHPIALFFVLALLLR